MGVHGYRIDRAGGFLHTGTFSGKKHTTPISLRYRRTMRSDRPPPQGYGLNAKMPQGFELIVKDKKVHQSWSQRHKTLLQFYHVFPVWLVQVGYSDNTTENDITLESEQRPRTHYSFGTTRLPIMRFKLEQSNLKGKSIISCKCRKPKTLF